ncbi:hypothetical protein pb186bvf_002954 [Paramecium bursaria]
MFWGVELVQGKIVELKQPTIITQITPIDAVGQILINKKLLVKVDDKHIKTRFDIGNQKKTTLEYKGSGKVHVLGGIITQEKKRQLDDVVETVPVAELIKQSKLKSHEETLNDIFNKTKSVIQKQLEKEAKNPQPQESSNKKAKKEQKVNDKQNDKKKPEQAKQIEINGAQANLQQKKQNKKQKEEKKEVIDQPPRELKWDELDWSDEELNKKQQTQKKVK